MTAGRSGDGPGGWQPGEIFRLCLDLNVWVAASLATVGGRTGTASLALVDAVRGGRCGLGPTQLVVSWGMLTRLDTVLTRSIGMRRNAVEAVIASIVAVTELGPAGTAPLAVLGGTGVLPLRDEEDLHVLDAAVAGRAHVVATYNFDDFVSYRTRLVVPGRVAIHRAAGHDVLIAHPAVAAGWVRTGEIALG